MKPTRYIYYSIVILAFVAAYFVFTENRKPRVGLSTTRNLESISLLGRVGEGHLVFENDEWTFNSSSNLRLSAVHDILKILKEVRMKQPVSLSEQKSVVEQAREHGTHVRVNFKNDKVFEFWIADGLSNLGTVYVNSDDEAFVVYIPGVNEPLARFFTPNASHWLPNMVFQGMTSRVTEIYVEDKSKPEESFVAELNADDTFFYSIDSSGKQELDFNEDKLQVFVSALLNLPFSEVYKGNTNDMQLMFSYKIVLESGDERTLDVLRIVTPEDKENPFGFTPDILVARPNNSNTILRVDFVKVAPMLKGISDLVR